MSEIVENEYASADELLVGDEITEQDVTLPNGKKLRVKGLSAYEHKLVLKNTINADGSVDSDTIENRLMHYGIVIPKMTMSQVEKWVKTASAGSVAAVSQKIRTLSGMGADAEKSDV